MSAAIEAEAMAAIAEFERLRGFYHHAVAHAERLRLAKLSAQDQATRALQALGRPVVVGGWAYESTPAGALFFTIPGPLTEATR